MYTVMTITDTHFNARPMLKEESKHTHHGGE